MDQHRAVDRGIRQRQRKFIDQGCQRWLRRSAISTPLGCRHERDAAFGVFAKQPEIRRRITDAEHALAFGSGQRAGMPRLINCRATIPRRCE